MSSYANVEMDIIRWSEARGIIKGSTAQAQFVKATAEFGELADCLIKHDIDSVQDSIGSVMICLINMSTILDVSIPKCMEIAYDRIKHRTGYINKNGVYVQNLK
tara:strand:- start:23 stop:334 length:312 start_codon:yes stop_codon:yes gene_type:complete